MHILALTASAFKCIPPSFNSILRASPEQGWKERNESNEKLVAFEYFLSHRRSHLLARLISGPITHRPSCLCSHFLHPLPENENKIQQYELGKIFPGTDATSVINFASQPVEPAVGGGKRKSQLLAPRDVFVTVSKLHFSAASSTFTPDLTATGTANQTSRDKLTALAFSLLGRAAASALAPG